ncbi:MAG: PAS domain S-box protein [Chloroflexi bacterium]|nr:PAS domain S-box protein [Chloroflexota bacterium]
MKSLPHESTLVESLIADTPTTLAEIRAQLQVYRDVFESAPFGCGLTNQDGIIQEANHALAQMLGRAPDALLAQPLREFVAADEIEREQFTLHLERLRAGHANEAWAMRFQSVTGEPFDAAVNVSCLANGRSTDGTMLLRWVVRDITRPKRTEGMLSQSEQKLRGIFDNSADGISLVDEQGVIVEWNASMERITGVTRAQVLGKTYRMIVPQLIANPLLARDLAARIHTRLMDASPWTGSTTELDLQRPDQKRCVVQLSVFPIITANGLMLGSIMRDITERKQMEDALRAANDELEARVSERTRALTQAIHELQNEVARRQGIEDSLRHRLRIEKIILNSVPVILYTLRRGEAQSNITWMSPNAEQITGFPPHRFNADPMFWLSRIHPADRAQVMERIHTLDHCALTPTEYRWQCADGGYRWFLDRIEGGTQDAPTEYVGTWLDITERKRAEEEEHTQRLLAEVLRDTAESFNNTLDADQVFKCLLTNVERLVPCDGVNVMLAAEGLPRLFAWHGYEKFAPPNLGADLDAIDSWRTFLRMAETGQPLLIPDIFEYG